MIKAVTNKGLSRKIAGGVRDLEKGKREAFLWQGDPYANFLKFISCYILILCNTQYFH